LRTEVKPIRVKVAGYSPNLLWFDPGISRCGSILDGVSFAHCGHNPEDWEGTWVIQFKDLERMYLAAKRVRRS